MRCLKCGGDFPYEEAIFCPHCGFKLKDVTVEKLFLPTPHGGIRSEISYFDENGNPCSKLVAAKIEVKEFDKDGKEVHSFRAHKRTAEEKAKEDEEREKRKQAEHKE